MGIVWNDLMRPFVFLKTSSIDELFIIFSKLIRKYQTLYYLREMDAQMDG